MDDLTAFQAATVYKNEPQPEGPPKWQYYLERLQLWQDEQVNILIKVTICSPHSKKMTMLK